MKIETLEEFLARGGTIQKITLADVVERGQNTVAWGAPKRHLGIGNGHRARIKTDSARDFGKGFFE